MKTVLSVAIEVVIYLFVVWATTSVWGLYGLVMGSSIFLIVKMELANLHNASTDSINRITHLFYLIGIARKSGVTKKTISDLYNELDVSTSVQNEEKDRILTMLNRL